MSERTSVMNMGGGPYKVRILASGLRKLLTLYLRTYQLMVWLVLSKEVLSFRTFGGLSLLLRNLEEGWVLITERPTKSCRSGIDIATREKLFV